MKKFVTFFVIIFPIISIITFSCKKGSVAVQVPSCVQATLSSAPGTDSQTVIINSAIIPITYKISTGLPADSSVTDTIKVNVSGTLPPGVTGHLSNGVFTISGTPTTKVGSPFTYIVSTSGSSCNNVNINGSIVVNDSIDTSLTAIVPANITVCSGQTISATTFSSLSVGATFTWTNNNTAIGLGASGSGNIASFITTNLTDTPITALIKVTPKTSQNIGTSSTYSITVNPLPTLVLTSVADSSNQTILLNTMEVAPIKFMIGGAATGAVLTGAPPGVTGNLTGSIFTISGTSTSTGTFSYTVTTSGGACSEASFNGTIIVIP